MSSSQQTNSYIFQRGRYTTNQITFITINYSYGKPLCHHPNRRTHIFFRGVGSNHQPDYIYNYELIAMENHYVIIPTDELIYFSEG